MGEFLFLDLESRFFQQPVPGIHRKKPPYMGVREYFQTALLPDQVDECHLEMGIAEIGIEAVLDERDLRIMPGMG